MCKLCRLMTTTFLIVATATAAGNVLVQSDDAEARAMFSEAVAAQDRWSDGKNVAVLTGAEALFLDSQS
jgi:hypothetical protein